MVEYTTNELLPGRLFFRCDRQRATLQVDSCAAMWRIANDLNDGTHGACRLCPLGSVHAGEVAASMSPLKGTKTCCRCHRGAERLIGGMICVSCYNRGREWLAGRNAKGTAPVKHTPLCSRRIRYVHGGDVQLLRMRHAVDTDELMVATLRDSRQRVAFGWDCSVPPALRQARLW